MKYIIVLSSLFLSLNLMAKEAEIPIGSEWLLLGMELAHQEKSGVDSPELENDGGQFGIYAAYSKYLEKYLYDVGFGFRYDKMENGGVTVETKAFSLNLGTRYRLNSRWSVGPDLQWLFGQDVSFSDTGTNSDDRNQAVFLGARVMFDVFEEEPRKQKLWRFGFRAMQDINISERDVRYYQFLLEYALPNRRAQKMIGLAPKPVLNLNLKRANINFVSSSSQLQEQSVLEVAKLAEILLKYDKEWDYIDISGHSDITGNYDNNVTLSWDRADSVKVILTEKGVSIKKIETNGYGPDKPLDPAKTTEAYRINRRVELGLFSDKASPEFVNEMKALFNK